MEESDSDDGSGSFWSDKDEKSAKGRKELEDTKELEDEDPKPPQPHWKYWCVALIVLVALVVLATMVCWVANKRFEISKFQFKFPRARTYEIIGLVLGCIEAKFCK